MSGIYNSVKDNVLGTEVIKKDADTIIVKSDNDSLYNPKPYVSDSELKELAAHIKGLMKKTQESGAAFLYCAAPVKEVFIASPQYIENEARDNYERFISFLDASDIPTLNLYQRLKQDGASENDLFFRTDHHWKPTTGFTAYQAICEELNTRYGFSYNAEQLDIDNYTIDDYTNWFLGSSGKKVGTYFTWKGADDFDLITPKFETHLTESQPFKNENRTGSFEESVMYTDNINGKDYYNKNPYATYSGGDFRLQIIKNDLNPSGKKVLIIRDSFANVVTPFLALQTGELHVVDIRDYDYYVGDRFSVYDYIDEIHPDYVLVLYSMIEPIEKTNSRFYFDLE